MSKLYGWLAAPALAIGLAMAPVATHARAVGHLDQGPVYSDSARCQVLAQQFAQAAVKRAIKDRTIRTAARGNDLCRAGNFAEGADALETAVRLIGLTPANPPALHPLA